jgi:anti-anti-sigma factor
MTTNSAFEIREAARQGWVRLSVSGELDAATALTFRRRLRALKAANTHVSVDLSELEFIDCAGAHALSDAIADSRQGSWRLQVEPNLSGQARHFFALAEAAGFTADF